MNSKELFNKHTCSEIPALCPKCKYNDIDFSIENTSISVYCKSCGLKGPIANTKDEAIKKWNNRFSNINRCFFCGTELNTDGICPTCNSVSINKSISDDNDEYNCCYIDILGFSNHTLHDDLKDCATIIDNYASIYQQRSITNCFTSFLYFYPASDSIFIISKEFDKFIQDIAEFCTSSLQMVLHNFVFPENKDDVTKVTISVISPLGVRKEERHWYPPIFSGGIAHGKILAIQQETLFNKKSIKTPNFLGDALTKAVHLGEENHNPKMHGARLFINSEIYSCLSKAFQDKYVYYHDGIFDILWPVNCFIDSNTIENNINNGINEMFRGMLNFYNQYKNIPSLEAVYFNTCKIIYISLIQYLKYRNASEDDFNSANQIIENMMVTKKLDYLFKDLRHPLIWR